MSAGNRVSGWRKILRGLSGSRKRFCSIGKKKLGEKKSPGAGSKTYKVFIVGVFVQFLMFTVQLTEGFDVTNLGLG